MKHITTMSRNCMTRALSITLILGLLLSSLAFSPNLSEIFNTNVWADTDGYWSEYTNTDWYYENQNKNEYSIATAEELAGFAKLVNDETDTFAGKTIKLTDNIDLGNHEWVPIGVDYTKPFKGNFDGDNKTISNMHIGTSEAPANYKYAGLFGYVEADSGETITIANVNIGENSWVYTYAGSTAVNAGGICAYAKVSAGTITISSCSNSAKIYISGGVSPYAGGICAKAYASAKDNAEATLTIINCSNSANIETETYMGGICAYAKADASAKITISNCSNSAEIKAGGVFPYAGGICAFAKADASAKITISNCSNSGNITVKTYFTDTYAGGICAYASADASAKDNAGAYAKITISNCSNSGTITASVLYLVDTATAAGGICAAAKADASAKITISNCSNSAGISSYVDNSSSSYYGRAYAGGICGVAKNLTISNCYYKEGTAKTGIGKKEDQIYPEDQAGETTALPESQMTAATGTMGEDWVDITIDGNSKGKMALVDALNTWVKAYNDTTPAIKALEWKVTTGNYPTLSIVDSVISTILPENQSISSNTDIAAQATEDKTQVEETPASTGEWSEYANTAWYYNNPDESTYKIGTAEELAGFAKLVNDGTDTFAEKTIQLTDNIDLGNHEWVPIGVDYTKPFKGNFDGDNKTISNMHIGTSEAPANYKYAGLFGYVEADSGETITIANVNIGENSWVYTSTTKGIIYAGGICAYAKVSAGTITISSCSNSGTITAFDEEKDSAAYAGGICAKAYASARSDAKADDDAYATATLIISNCSNSGTITAFAEEGYSFAEEGYSFADAGGICASADAYAIRAYDDDELKAETILTINNCKNSGTIESNSARSVTTGGICASANTYAANTNVTAKITIINCSNSGTITAFDEEKDSAAYAGGICARACGIKLSSVTIINCSNSAGISSYVDNSSSSYYGRAYAGGICGVAKNLTISNCYYKEGTAKTGIGKKEDQIYPEDQAGEITALPESQMTAAENTMNGQDWVDITIDGDGQGKRALVDALNYYVDNNLNNGLLNWIQDDDVNDGYPTIVTNNNNAN